MLSRGWAYDPQDYPENLECLRYLVAICKDLGQRCDGFQAKLAKLERDSAVNSNMPPPQQQQAPPVGNGHSSRNSNADDNDEPRAPLSYQRQPQEIAVPAADSGRGASLYGNGTGTPEPRTRDSEDNGRSEYVAPPQMQTMVTPTTARAPQPQKTARASKHEDTDWGDADVGNL
ncbi:uncharacterized protein KRP23_10527 [Phytophthora ramorum]|uniref:uncharacterized protein n=1 Tax=Phytophthora ramorum TaxID=164328 RepID=UPI0030A4FD1C|nr:hypothetical protein KRP23_10527 [Phytophthora ramorum]